MYASQRSGQVQVGFPPDQSEGTEYIFASHMLRCGLSVSKKM